MKVNGKSWKVALLFFIIVPVGLLVTFGLTDVFKQPVVTTKTIVVEPVNWSFERPSEAMKIEQLIENQWKYLDEEIHIGVKVLSYYEKDVSEPFWGHDGVVFKTYVNASFTQGYINTIRINFTILDDSAVLFVSRNPWSLQLDNATLKKINYFGTNETDGYIEANILKQSCCIKDQIFWVFLDENYENHELQVTSEVTHTNETACETITIPIKMKISPSGES